ncbi:DUF4038 domain-containing protein [Flavobacterium sp. 7A]|uniref:apiosidase-like domain-containing protein n=1 Tax=Flavobacterium sp. 7A TaxID=2940571 RepID=UPI00222610E2|nr:DUF4038 domain-containing protein [Flavobacterium sp. 7A]MCW2121218.1 hypothetical protein [Flavobacterium sp. 7A]
MKNKIIILFVCCAFSFSKAQIKKWDNPKANTLITIPQWEVNDLVFHLKNKVEAPFDKNVFALVNANGESQRVPLFFNGNNTWVLRYSSASEGIKNFSITGDIKELSGKKGSISILKNTKKDRHGGITTSKENPQHFFYQDGKHYSNLAFECDWLFALDYGQKELSKTNQLLETIRQNGFSQIVMNLYTYDVSWPKDPLLAQHPEHEYGGSEKMFPFLGSNSKPDFSSLNVAFFDHFDKVIASMHDKELVSHLMIYVWNKKVAWPEMNSPEDNRYYDYVIKRYQAFPNMIWDVSKEALHYGRATNKYISERIARTKKLDGYQRLISVHDYGFCRNHPDEVDFISTQNWRHTLYQHMIDARTDFPNKPIFNIEHGGYEEAPYKVFPGAYTNAESCLRRNYMCFFAGAYSTYYWQGTSWNAIIHNPFEQPRGVYKPRFDYFSHMRKLYDTFNIENFKPSPNNNGSGYNLSNEKEGIIMLFMPKENFTIMFDGLINKDFSSANATQQWFNTYTGEFSEERKYEKIKDNFWPWQPWRGEADTILIIRNLKSKKK